MPRSQRILVFGCVDTSISKYRDMRSFKVKFNWFICFLGNRSGEALSAFGCRPIIYETCRVYLMIDCWKPWCKMCGIYGKVHNSRKMWRHLSTLPWIHVRGDHNAPSWMNIWILINFRRWIFSPGFKKRPEKMIIIGIQNIFSAWNMRLSVKWLWI